VSYRRQVDRGPDQAPATQLVTRTVSLEALFGEDAADVVELRALWVRYPWDREHPWELVPRPAFFFAGF